MKINIYIEIKIRKALQMIGWFKNVVYDRHIKSYSKIQMVFYCLQTGGAQKYV